MGPRVPSLTPDDLRRLLPALSTVEEIGHGGQKQVFKAIAGGRPVAVKVVLADHATPFPTVDTAAATVISGEDSTVTLDDEEPFPDEGHLVPPRLRREVDLLALLDSPHVVPLVELDGRRLRALPDRGRVYLVYAEAWVDGVDLNVALNRGQNRMSQPEAMRLALDGVAGITALWSHEIVHRDIKPHNIMRRNDGRFVLIDLGLALDIQAETITETGVWLGTEAFTAPEVNDPELRPRIDFRADLFSLGVVLYEALSAQHPYQARAKGRTVTGARRLMRNPPSPLGEIAEQTHPGFVDIVMRLIQADLDLRYARLAQVEAALREVAAELGVHP